MHTLDTSAPSERRISKTWKAESLLLPGLTVIGIPVNNDACVNHMEKKEGVILSTARVHK